MTYTVSGGTLNPTHLLTQVDFSTMLLAHEIRFCQNYFALN